MTAPCFVDSNVLVSRRDASEPTKQPVAETWMRLLWQSRRGRVSAQVLEEYYQIVTRKLRPGLPRDEARRDVRALCAWRPVPAGASLIEAAWEVEDRHGLSFWDSLIVAAARHARCAHLLTEDLQDGADLDGIRVVDPFRHSPTELGFPAPSR